MSSYQFVLKQFLFKILQINPKIILAIFLGVNCLIFGLCLVLGRVWRYRRRQYKKAFLHCTNILTLLVFSYCLTLKIFAGRLSLPISLLLTCLFYLAAVFKYYFMPVRFIKNRRAAVTTCDAPKNDTTYNDLHAKQEILSVFDKLRLQDYNEIKPPNLENLSKFTNKLDKTLLSAHDSDKLAQLEQLAKALQHKENITGDEMHTLNDKLLGLIKMLSKYNAS